MQLVGTALDGRVHHGSGRIAILSRVVVRLHAELLYSIDRGLHHHGRTVLLVDDLRIVVDSVEQKVIQLRADSVGYERTTGSIPVALFGFDNASRQTSQLQKITSVQRKFRDRLCWYCRTE